MLVLTVAVGILLSAHTALIMALMKYACLPWFESSCASAILLLLCIYILVRTNRKLEIQIGNFIYFRGKRYYKELLGEATHDGLTGLYNHKYFMIMLQQELERAKRYRRRLSLLMIDVDLFKRYNDTYGHLEGDRVLTGLAVVFRHLSRQVDIVARYGGEEFVVLLPETDPAGARTMAERIRAYVEESQSLRPGVTISVGIGHFDGTESGMSCDGLIKRADEACYRAKSEGRNRVSA